ncbi:hypothetical protein [Eubacterium sp.]|nr:hypothetical protein [Eubacterium sp.]MCR5629980.1 hypothetical protein [Eubacterium sp.]
MKSINILKKALVALTLTIVTTGAFSLDVALKERRIIPEDIWEDVKGIL